MSLGQEIADSLLFFSIISSNYCSMPLPLLCTQNVIDSKKKVKALFHISSAIMIITLIPVLEGVVKHWGEWLESVVPYFLSYQSLIESVVLIIL